MTDKFIGKAWLAELGYKNVEHNPMASEIERWWGWYTTQCEWYESKVSDGNMVFDVKRISIKPAKMVCEDWASLIFNERAEIGVGGDDNLKEANAWLKKWVNDKRFIQLANRTVERTMALGTAGWALRIVGIDEATNKGTDILCDRYDARHIIPLAFDGDTCTEALFRSTALVDGKLLNQLRLYRVGDEGNYEINTAFFTDTGKRITNENVIDVFDTGSPTPPFALLKPGIDNSYLEFHPFGVSVFDEALGAVITTDMAIDNLYRDIYQGQKMTFLPEGMLKENAQGKIIIPRAVGQQNFVAYSDEDGYINEEKGKPYEYNPDLRVEDNRLAIKTALELLGDRAGLGKDYYGLDESGGINRTKTAREVASDQTKLMRNIRKHEESILPAVQTICEALCALANTCLGLNIPDVTGNVDVVFGDSIIEDEEALRQRDRDEVAAGLMAPWEYIAKYRAVSDDEAKDIYADIVSVYSEPGDEGL